MDVIAPSGRTILDAHLLTIVRRPEGAKGKTKTRVDLNAQMAGQGLGYLSWYQVVLPASPAGSWRRVVAAIRKRKYQFGALAATYLSKIFGDT